MSNINSDDPFEDSKPQQAPDAKPEKKSRFWIWVIGVFGGLCLLGLLVCCGAGFWLLNFLTDGYQQQLTGNPAITEHIGQIQSMKMNLTKTAEESENAGDNTFAFDIQGSDASATILIKQDSAGDGTKIEAATLILSDGSRHQVPMGGADTVITPDNENFEIDLGEIDAEMEDLKNSIPSP